MSRLLALLFLGTGSMFMLLAALGIVRMPDLFTRMQSSTKASTLGMLCVMLGAAIHFGRFDVTARLMLIVLFTFLTAPIAAHLLSRAAYALGVPLWEGTVVDDLRARIQQNRPPEEAAAATIQEEQ